TGSTVGGRVRRASARSTRSAAATAAAAAAGGGGAAGGGAAARAGGRARVGDAAVGDAQAQVRDAEIHLGALDRGHALLVGGAAAEARRGAGHRAGGVAVVEAHALEAVLHVPAVVAELARAQLGGDLGAGIVADREALLGVRDVAALTGIAGVGHERHARLVVAAHQQVLAAAEA